MTLAGALLGSLWTALNPLTWLWVLGLEGARVAGLVRRAGIVEPLVWMYVTRRDDGQPDWWLRYWARRIDGTRPAGWAWGGLAILVRDGANTEFVAHERAHARQHRILGPLFHAAYAALWLYGLVMPGRDAMRDHPLEVDARRRASAVHDHVE